MRNHQFILAVFTIVGLLASFDSAYANGVALRVPSGASTGVLTTVLSASQVAATCVKYEAVYVNNSLVTATAVTPKTITFSGLNKIFSDSSCTSLISSQTIGAGQKSVFFYISQPIALPTTVISVVMTGFSIKSTLNLTVTSATVTTSGCTNSNSPVSRYVPRAMWAWYPTAIVVPNSAAQNEFFRFALEKNIRTVYLSVETMLNRYKTTSPDTATENNLPLFVTAAAARCMSVHLLYGNLGSFVQYGQASTGYPAALKVVNDAKDYFLTRFPAGSAKPAAWHWDIEPAELTDWHGNEVAYLQRLVNLLTLTKNALGSTMKLSADIPHWWLSTNATFSGVVCGPNGTSLYAVQCLIKVLDSVVLMDYSDQAATSIAQGIDEVNYASLTQNFYGGTTSVVIGQETKDLSASTNTAATTWTFFEELRDPTKGVNAMEAQLQKIHNSFNGKSGYGGKNLESLTNPYDPASPEKSRYLFLQSDDVGIAIHHNSTYNMSGIVDNFTNK